MAFLDNSGDIILDAVLTDAGRKRLAAGDGSFRIAKFALGDDEIDYSLYNTGATSGQEDLRILQLPVFESFTNNTSVLKNKLLTYADNSLLYLPVVKLNNIPSPGAATLSTGGYRAAVDNDTQQRVSIDIGAGAEFNDGYRDISQRSAFASCRLVFDQGLDTNDLPLAQLEDTQRQLMETQYIIEVDNRLLQVSDRFERLATPTFIDDDSVASYYLSLNSNEEDGYFGPIRIFDQDGTPSSPNKVIGPQETTGRVGKRLFFGLKATLDLQASNTLFSQLGKTGQTFAGYPAPHNQLVGTYGIIDTVVRVTGFTTGYRVDVPIQLIKLES